MKYSQNKILNKFEVNYNIEKKGAFIKSVGKMGKIEKKLKLQTAVIKGANEIYYIKNHGDSRVILGTIKQQIQGVLAGFCIEVKIVGLGYVVYKVGQSLILDLGFSHYRSCKIPLEVLVKIEGSHIIVYSINKEKVTTFVSLLKTFKRINIYKGTGIIGINEKLKLKKGKVR